MIKYWNNYKNEMPIICYLQCLENRYYAYFINHYKNINVFNTNFRSKSVHKKSSTAF